MKLPREEHSLEPRDKSVRARRHERALAISITYLAPVIVYNRW